MRPRIAIIIVLMGIAAVLGLWTIRPLGSHVPPRTSEPAVGTASTQMSNTTRVASNSNVEERRSNSASSIDATALLMTHLRATNREGAWKEIAELARSNGISMVIVTQMMMQAMSNVDTAFRDTIDQPIAFYGKVLDQHAAPIGGAHVQLSWTGYTGKHSKTNLTTDDSGAFALDSATGAFLTVHLSKEGYQPSATNQYRFEYYSPGGISPFRPDPAMPVTFQLEKQP